MPSLFSVPLISQAECSQEEVYGGTMLSSGMFCAGYIQVNGRTMLSSGMFCAGYIQVYGGTCLVRQCSVPGITHPTGASIDQTRSKLETTKQ